MDSARSHKRMRSGDIDDDDEVAEDEEEVVLVAPVVGTVLVVAIPSLE